MNLVIRAHSLKTESLSQPIAGHFDERGGTIGRSDTNTLALPDPERHISRLQAEVWFSNGSFSIRNVGSANAISINGRPINPGEGCTLAEGDELVVGGYTLRASLSADGSSDAPTEIRPMDGRTVIRASSAESKTNPRMPASLAAPAASPVTVRASTTSSNPFADLLGTGASAAADPFAGLVDGSQVSPPTTAAFVRKPGRTSAPAPVAAPTPAAPSFLSSGPAQAPAPARLPDDFDPFADVSPAPGSKADAALASFVGGSPSADPQAPAALPADLGLGLGDLIGTPAQSGSSLDAMFGLQAGSSRDSDPLAGFMAPSKADAASGARPPSTDPLAMFGAATPAAAGPAIPADFDHTPEMQGAYKPPAVVSPKTLMAPPVQAPAAKSPVSAPAAAPWPAAAKAAAPPMAAPAPVARAAAPQPAAPGRGDGLTTDTVPGLRPRREAFAISAPAPLNSSADASAAALWAAFCEGAGISFNPPQGLNPDLMKMIGQLLHHSVEGTLKLVAIRAAAKQELRADVTTIQARNNNPLKFSPDAGVAIQQLLQPPMRGFMVGPAAVTEVMDDLLGHAIGTMAGMRAALEGVLKRFEPGQLEGKLAGNSMLDSVLPMNRRAKLWELYLQHYQRIHDEAQDDFHDLFGKAFINAYEEQLDRLDAARHPV